VKYAHSKVRHDLLLARPMYVSADSAHSILFHHAIGQQRSAAGMTALLPMHLQSKCHSGYVTAHGRQDCG